jgi:hypothetical protein
MKTKRHFLLSAAMAIICLLSSAQVSKAQTALVQPIRGSFINLIYQDVRNKYTNPQYFDNTDPAMWREKVRELHAMGIEYLVLLAVANEGKSYYPSHLMPPAYNKTLQSPVDAIMDEAARLQMKVFMSIGWAQSQDDNLQDPSVRQRQLDMMKELASVYGHHRALYGWYLPVEDCLCPIFAEHAVKAVNELTARARSLTPGKKILISPYGIYESAFEDPQFERQLAKLKVDIIAYQDEVGCVREPLPLPRLKKHWQLLREIHNRLHIGLWANVESFTWEGATNDRTSALIPAAFPRLLSQLAIASEAHVDNIISFSVCGVFETPGTSFHLGQPVWAEQMYRDYMSWKKGDEYWKLMEAAFCGRLKNTPGAAAVGETLLTDGQTAQEDTTDRRWVPFEKGYHEVVVDMQRESNLRNVLVRMLSYHHGSIALPQKMCLYVSSDGKTYRPAGFADAPLYPNDRHDAWVDAIYFPHVAATARYVKIAFYADTKVLMDEVFVNPSAS